MSLIGTSPTFRHVRGEVRFRRLNGRIAAAGGGRFRTRCRHSTIVAAVDQSHKMVKQAAAATPTRFAAAGLIYATALSRGCHFRRDVRHGGCDQFNAGMAGCARRAARDTARPQTRWRKSLGFAPSGGIVRAAMRSPREATSPEHHNVSARRRKVPGVRVATPPVARGVRR